MRTQPSKRQIRRALAAVAAALLLASCLAAARHSSPSSVATGRSPSGALSSTGTLDQLVVRPSEPARLGRVTAAAPSGPVTDVAIAPPPAAFDAEPAPPAPPPRVLLNAAPPSNPQPGIWAVMIGINDYPGSRSDLRSAVTDADDMDLALGGLGVAPERRLVLFDREASADTIRRAADWLVLNAGPDATAVFYYAGHVRRLGGSTQAIVAADGEVITDTELAQRLAPLAARHLWLVMATCFGGGFTEPLGPGRVLTAAADADSLAYENLTFGRSYLGEYLVNRALVGGGARPTVQDAFNYAYWGLAHDYPNRVPFQDDRAGDTVSLFSRGDRVVSPPAPEPQPESSSASSSPPPTAAQPPPSGSGGGDEPRRRRRPSGGGGSGGGGDDEECVGIQLGVVGCG